MKPCLTIETSEPPHLAGATAAIELKPQSGDEVLTAHGRFAMPVGCVSWNRACDDASRGADEL